MSKLLDLSQRFLPLVKGEGVTPFPYNAPVCFVRNSWWFSHVEAECTMSTTNILYYVM